MILGTMVVNVSEAVTDNQQSDENQEEIGYNPVWRPHVPIKDVPESQSTSINFI